MPRLRLYVTGSTPRSLKAIERLRRLCDQHLPGEFDLRVIDIYQEPELARAANLVATPTLVREDSEPARTLVGDLAAEDRVVKVLKLPSRAPERDEGDEEP